MMGVHMMTASELKEAKQETTIPARVFVPNADIYEMRMS
jgi:hypothetical protein